MSLKFFKNQFVFLLFLISLTIFFSFGQVLLFDVWQDDNALIFKVQHPDEQAGVFGAGPLGLGAYKYVAFPYILLSKIFGVNIQVFYLVGIILYFFAAICVYLFSRALFKNSVIASFASLIFAAGYIGSESVIRLFNSLQTSLSIILTVGVFANLYLFHIRKRYLYYMSAFLLFILAIEVGYARVQFIILPVFVFWLLFLTNSVNPKSLFKNFILFVPFGLSYFKYYLENPDARSNLIQVYLSKILSGNLEYLHSFLATTGNIFIPDRLINSLFSSLSLIYPNQSNLLPLMEVSITLIFFISFYKFLNDYNFKIRIIPSLSIAAWLFIHWTIFSNADFLGSNFDQNKFYNLFANFIGGIMIITVVSLISLLKNIIFSKKLALFLFVWLLSNILTYSFYLPFNPLETTNRYLTHSLVPFSILTPYLVFFVFKTLLKVDLTFKFFYLFCFLIIIGNFILSLIHQNSFYQSKVVFIKSFYKSLKQQIPTLKKGSVLFFQVADNPRSRSQFSDFFSVGSMPDSTAIAIRYGIDRYDFKMTSDFDEFLSFLKQERIDISKIYSFYYEDGSLISKTTEFREILTGDWNFKDKLRSVNQKNEEIEIVFQDIPAYPLDLSFDGKAVFAGEDKIFTRKNCENVFDDQTIEQITTYLKESQKLSSSLKIIAASEEKYFKKSNLADGDINSVWRGRRGKWLEEHKESITLSFLEKTNIDKLIWINAYPNSTPISYSIFASEDGASWEEVVKVLNGGKRDKGSVIEKINRKNIRFIKFEIYETYDGDSPAMSEIEVLTDQMTIEKNKVESFLKDPFGCLKEEKFIQQAIIFAKDFGLNIPLTTVYTSNIRTDYINLKMDNSWNRYSVFLEINGGYLNKFLLKYYTLPLEIDLKNIEIKYPWVDKVGVYN